MEGSSSIYIPLACLTVVSLGFVFVAMTIQRFLGPSRPEGVKQIAYECGNIPIGDARIRYNPRFYLLAVIFIVFEVELVFLSPWAVQFRQLGWKGLAEALIFIAILLLGLAYAWRKGDLEWD